MHQEPVSWEGAGDIENPCGAVGQRPCQSDSEGAWYNGVLWKTCLEGVDYRWSSRPEVPVNQDDSYILRHAVTVSLHEINASVVYVTI